MALLPWKNMKKIILVSDTSYPDVNGVATTIRNYQANIKESCLLSSHDFKSFKCPFSNDVRLAYDVEFDKDLFTGNFAVHIFTEGTLGLSTRKFCLQNDIKFTTSYLTMFPEYIKSYTHIPLFITRAYFKWFHSKSSKVLCCTNDLVNKLSWLNHNNMKVSPKGVNLDFFKCKSDLTNNNTALYVGRVSKEKNLDAFCQSTLPIQKIVVGDGPLLPYYKQKYKDVYFLGKKTGDELIQAYHNADVFVFPSKTDTYGLVMLEALACGLPVAAYPINGALDLQDEKTVFCDEILDTAISNAFSNLDVQSCREHAEQYSWDIATDKFLNNLIFN